MSPPSAPPGEALARTVLVGVDLGAGSSFDPTLDELALLAESAGDEPVARLVARRKAPDAALFVGSGKADEIKALVVDDKWLATIASAAQGELDRVSQTLTGRIRQLAERYAIPLPQLIEEVAAIAARVDDHLRKMGAVWN